MRNKVLTVTGQLAFCRLNNTIARYAIVLGALIACLAMFSADMNAEEHKASDEIRHTLLPPQGLFAAKFRVARNDPTRLELAYYHDAQINASDHQVRRMSLQSDGTAIIFPGQYVLKVIDAATEVGADQKETPYTLSVTRKGITGFNLVVGQGDNIIAQGLGVIDPDDPQSLLVSGWTGSVEPYGVVKYSIRDAKTIKGYYLSKMSPDYPGIDTAIGNTQDGFPGIYSLSSQEKSGRTWGPQEWQLSQRGDVIDLVWREQGAVICRGFGIIDPQDSDAIIVNYIPVKK